MGAHLPLGPAGETQWGSGETASAGAPQTNSRQARCPPAPRSQGGPQPQLRGGQPQDALPAHTHARTLAHSCTHSHTHSEKPHANTRIFSYLHTAHTHTVSANLSACSHSHTPMHTHTLIRTCSPIHTMHVSTHALTFSHAHVCTQPALEAPLPDAAEYSAAKPSKPPRRDPSATGSADDRLLALSGQ